MKKFLSTYDSGYHVSYFYKNLTSAFQKINSLAKFDDLNKKFSNIRQSYVNDDKPKDSALVKDVFKKGLLLSFIGIKDGIGGILQLIFKELLLNP